jgi:DNA mismatch endonuclease, patch repair protein
LIVGSKRRTPELEVDEKTSRRLGRVRQKDTAAELLVRRAAYAEGFRFTVRNGDLPGRPDLANRSNRWAVFVHGCFWHRHAGCVRTTTPKRNREFWQEKFGANTRRDTRVVKSLRAMGYSVLTVWECEAEQARVLSGKLRSLRQRLANRE